jgi:Poly(hydroxyalcanoate) granule associated protein (phasin)
LAACATIRAILEKQIMLNTFQQRANRVGDTVFAASRQMWLAGLGAAVVTRDWAEKEASGVFRTLVKEGTAVESRAIRIVGDQVESSVTKANVVLKRTRTAIGNVVRVYTNTAAGIVQSLPRLLPAPAKAPAQRHAKVTRKSAAKTARNVGKRIKRATKATSKR